MNPRGMNGPGLAVAVTMAGALTALVAAIGLPALARPADRAERVAALQVKLDRLQRLERAPVGGLVYPKGAVCREGAMRGEALVEQKLRAALGQGRLVSLAFDPAAATSDGAPTAIGLQFEVEGSYDDATALLAALAAVRPTIFADTIDLQTRTSAVALHFSGRFYCSPSARL